MSKPDVKLGQNVVFCKKHPGSEEFSRSAAVVTKITSSSIANLAVYTDGVSTTGHVADAKHKDIAEENEAYWEDVEPTLEEPKEELSEKDSQDKKD